MNEWLKATKKLRTNCTELQGWAVINSQYLVAESNEGINRKEPHKIYVSCSKMRFTIGLLVKRSKVVHKVVHKRDRVGEAPFLCGFAQLPRVRSRSPAFLRAVSLDLSGF